MPAVIPVPVIEAIQSAFDAAEETQAKIVSQQATASTLAAAVQADEAAKLAVQQAQQRQAVLKTAAETALSQALGGTPAPVPTP